MYIRGHSLAIKPVCRFNESPHLAPDSIVQLSVPRLAQRVLYQQRGAKHLECQNHVHNQAENIQLGAGAWSESLCLGAAIDDELRTLVKASHQSIALTR